MAQAAEADRVITALSQSLHRVAGMAQAAEAGVADQTELPSWRSSSTPWSSGRDRGSVYPANLTDLGEGGLGCRIEQSVSIATGQLVELLLTLKGHHLEIDAAAARVSHAGTETVLGLEFLHPTPLVCRVLDEFITEQLDGIDSF